MPGEELCQKVHTENFQKIIFKHDLIHFLSLVVFGCMFLDGTEEVVTTAT